jgi:hypothetical protein
VRLVIGSRASAATFRRTLRSLQYPSVPLATRPTPSVFPSSTALSGRAQGKDAFRTMPQHVQKAADVGTVPRRVPKFARSRAGSPTRATRHKAIFPIITPPYPKGGA